MLRPEERPSNTYDSGILVRIVEKIYGHLDRLYNAISTSEKKVAKAINAVKEDIGVVDKRITSLESPVKDPLPSCQGLAVSAWFSLLFCSFTRHKIFNRLRVFMYEWQYSTDSSFPDSASTYIHYSFSHIAVLYTPSIATYYVRVRAVAVSGDVGPWCTAVSSTSLSITSDTTAPLWWNPGTLAYDTSGTASIDDTATTKTLFYALTNWVNQGIKFRDASDSGSGLSHYIVAYRIDTLDDDTEWKTIIFPAGLVYTASHWVYVQIPYLKYNTPYEFKVAAVDKFGNSTDFSAVFDHTIIDFETPDETSIGVIEATKSPYYGTEARFLFGVSHQCLGIKVADCTTNLVAFIHVRYKISDSWIPVWQHKIVEVKSLKTDSSQNMLTSGGDTTSYYVIPLETLSPGTAYSYEINYTNIGLVSSGWTTTDTFTTAAISVGTVENFTAAVYPMFNAFPKLLPAWLHTEWTIKSGDNNYVTSYELRVARLKWGKSSWSSSSDYWLWTFPIIDPAGAGATEQNTRLVLPPVFTTFGSAAGYRVNIRPWYGTTVGSPLTDSDWDDPTDGHWYEALLSTPDADDVPAPEAPVVKPFTWRFVSVQFDSANTYDYPVHFKRFHLHVNFNSSFTPDTTNYSDEVIVGPGSFVKDNVIPCLGFIPFFVKNGATSSSAAKKLCTLADIYADKLYFKTTVEVYNISSNKTSSVDSGITYTTSPSKITSPTTINVNEDKAWFDGWNSSEGRTPGYTNNDWIPTPAVVITEPLTNSETSIDVINGVAGFPLLAADDLVIFGKAGRPIFTETAEVMRVVSITAGADGAGGFDTLNVTRGWKGSSPEASSSALWGGDILIKVGRYNTTYSFMYWDSATFGMKTATTDDSAAWDCLKTGGSVPFITDKTSFGSPTGSGDIELAAGADIYLSPVAGNAAKINFGAIYTLSGISTGTGQLYPQADATYNFQLGLESYAWTTLYLYAATIYCGGNLNVADHYVKLIEIAAPSSPAANAIYLYCKDDSGTSKLYYKRSDGTEVECGGSGSGSGDRIEYASAPSNTYVDCGAALVMINSTETGGNIELNCAGDIVMDSVDDIIIRSSDALDMHGDTSAKMSYAGTYPRVYTCVDNAEIAYTSSIYVEAEVDGVNIIATGTGKNVYISSTDDISIYSTAGVINFKDVENASYLSLTDIISGATPSQIEYNDLNWVHCLNGQVQAYSSSGGVVSGDIITIECDSLTGWTDDDTGTGESTQVTEESKSCFKFNCPATNDVARRYKDCGTVTGDPFYIEFSTKFTSIGGTQAGGDYLWVNVRDAADSVNVRIAADGIFVYDGGAYNEVGAVTFAADVWYKILVKVNVATSTCDVYLDGVLLESGMAIATGSYTDGWVEFYAQNATAAIVAFVDYLYVGSGISESYVSITPSGVSICSSDALDMHGDTSAKMSYAGTYPRVYTCVDNAEIAFTSSIYVEAEVDGVNIIATGTGKNVYISSTDDISIYSIAGTINFKDVENASYLSLTDIISGATPYKIESSLNTSIYVECAIDNITMSVPSLVNDKSIFTNDCDSLSGWTENNTGSGDVVQGTYHSESCFLFTCAYGSDLAQIYQDIGTITASDFIVSIRFQINDMPSSTSDGFFRFKIARETYSLTFSVDDVGVRVYNGSWYTVADSTFTVDEWHTVTIIVTNDTTCSVYLDDSLCEAEVDCSFNYGGGNSGLIEAALDSGTGTAHAHLDYYYIGIAEPASQIVIDALGVNIPNSSGLILGEDAATNTPGVLKFFSDGANNYYTTFTTATQTENCTYTLPTAMPDVTGYVLSCTDTGEMSWVVGGGGASAIDDLSDVDTTTDAPVKNEVLKWNGTNWVPATYDATFTFSIATFDEGESTHTVLIGSGVWKTDETMSCTATYNNGPPTSADIEMRENSGSYSKVGEMSGPAYTSGTNTEGNINYPDTVGDTYQFRLNATDGTDSDTETTTAITFYNYRFWGTLDHNTGINEADIESLSSELSNSTTYSKTINSSSGQYIVIAHRSALSALEDGDDYEDDGNSDFLFNSISLAMTDLGTVSVTNSAGFAENYRVYAATTANLGNYTLSCSSSTSAINKLYYGITTETSGWDEADIEGLANSSVTNDNTQTWSSVTTGSGEYMLFAFPKRLGTVTFYVGGFEGGFESPATVSVTNANGWIEDYYVWRSTNSNLGATIVTTA